MANNTPSMTALLGLLAVAGWQNRDKIAQVLHQVTSGDAQGAPSAGPQAQGAGAAAGTGGGLAGSLGGILSGLTGGQQGNLGSVLGGLAAGGGAAIVANGLQELIDHLQQRGLGPQASSWVSSGANQDVSPQQLGQAIDPAVLSDVIQKTGLTREDLLERLSQVLPQAVDSLTPGGYLPTSS